MQTRFISHIGTRAYLRVYWSTNDNGLCEGYGYHNSSTLLTASDKPWDHELGGEVADHPRESFGTACERCGAARPDEANFMVSRKPLYDTASGNPEPGDLYYADWYGCAEGHGCVWGWTNCDGRHLFCILPTGEQWDIDGRANNCTMRDDKTHRCWIRHGEPPNVHVDKNGFTCAAGAGSIAVPKYHGFLHHGVLTDA